MINGAHVVVYTKDAEADRALFRGWLIFGLPKAESAFHPAGLNGRHEFYLMCDDLKAEIEALRAKRVESSAIVEEAWGSLTRVRLPGVVEIGLYQPKHQRPQG